MADNEIKLPTEQEVKAKLEEINKPHSNDNRENDQLEPDGFQGSGKL